MSWEIAYLASILVVAAVVLRMYGMWLGEKRASRGDDLLTAVNAARKAAEDAALAKEAAATAQGIVVEMQGTLSALAVRMGLRRAQSPGHTPEPEQPA